MQLRATALENLEPLLLKGLRMGRHLDARKLRTRGGTPARVTDHRREVADDEHGPMTELLKLPQLGERDRVPEVDVRRARIDTQLHPQGPPALQAREQLALGNDVRRSHPERLELLLR